MQTFKTLQTSLFKFTLLIHFDLCRTLYVELNFNEINIDVMMYYVIGNKIDASIFEYSFKNKVQSIMFFNRLLTSARLKY